nr:DUF4399 domain-containing protein [Marinobacter caseinilyticus]
MCNMDVAPVAVEDGTGHHRLLSDTEIPADLITLLAAMERVWHFGGGQTETEITRPPDFLRECWRIPPGRELHL